MSGANLWITVSAAETLSRAIIQRRTKKKRRRKNKCTIKTIFSSLLNEGRKSVLSLSHASLCTVELCLMGCTCVCTAPAPICVYMRVYIRAVLPRGYIGDAIRDKNITKGDSRRAFPPPFYSNILFTSSPPSSCCTRQKKTTNSRINIWRLTDTLVKYNYSLVHRRSHTHTLSLSQANDNNYYFNSRRRVDFPRENALFLQFT